MEPWIWTRCVAKRGTRYSEIFGGGSRCGNPDAAAGNAAGTRGPLRDRPGRERGGKNDAGLGWVCGRFDRPEENVALDILTEILCATNASPLKRALLETGLAQDVELYFQNGIQQPYLMLLVRNVREDQREQVFGKVTETLEKLVKDGWITASWKRC